MRIIALLAALAVVLLAAGCTTQAEPAPATATAAPTPEPTTIATTAPPTTPPTSLPTTLQPRKETLEVTVHGMTEYPPESKYVTPRPGYAYLLVDFSVKNIGVPNGYSYNPNYVKVSDPDGFRYGYAAHSYSVPGYFGSAVIPYGETVRGKLLFEVPPNIVGTKYLLWVG